MSEMLHKVMDAIAPGCFSEHCCDADRYEIEMMARRAIAVMREPTEAMINAGGSWTRDEEKYQRKCYTAMIDAALPHQHPQPDIAEGIAKVNDAHGRVLKIELLSGYVCVKQANEGH